jgi:hypothetical protein
MQPKNIPPDAKQRIQAMANILSLVAIVGRMENTAIQRVLIALGAAIMEVPEGPQVSPAMVHKMLDAIVKERGKEAADYVLMDMAWVAQAWEPVLEEYAIEDPYRLMPFAEIAFQLVNYSGVVLNNHEAFDLFGGPDVVLPMSQLSAALRPYALPVTGLTWKMVGFKNPADQALVGSSEGALYLFKSASSGIDLRFSELERGTDEGARREFDIRVDTPMFGAFVAGLLGDMLYWAARLRGNALPSQELWRRLTEMMLPIAEKSPPQHESS